MSDPSVPGLGPGYRLTVEDAPAEADVEVPAGSTTRPTTTGISCASG
jgi:hypothetical protein